MWKFYEIQLSAPTKVLFEHKHTLHLHIVYGSFPTPKAYNTVAVASETMASKLRIFTLSSFTENVCQPLILQVSLLPFSFLAIF